AGSAEIRRSVRRQLTPARRHLAGGLALPTLRELLLPLGEQIGSRLLPLRELLRRKLDELAAGGLDVLDRALLEFSHPVEIVLPGLRGLIEEDLLNILRQPLPGPLAHHDVVPGDRRDRPTAELARLVQTILLDVPAIEEGIVDRAPLQRLVHLDDGYGHGHCADRVVRLRNIGDAAGALLVSR